MIFYFSGTGNTRYVAESLGNLLEEDLVFIPGTDPNGVKLTGNRVLFCFPVYSWGVPPLVLDFIAALPDSFVREAKAAHIAVSMVCTCGDEVAETPAMFRNAITSRGLRTGGLWSVTMPNDYVLLPGFDVDPREVEDRKLDSSQGRIKEIAGLISRGEYREDFTVGKWPRLKSKVIYPLFRRWGVNSKRWHVSQECVGCGRCVTACPMHNIKLVTGKPHWGHNCVSCTACYQHCPAHAISYGKFTDGKGQYFCHVKPLKKH